MSGSVSDCARKRHYRYGSGMGAGALPIAFGSVRLLAALFRRAYEKRFEADADKGEAARKRPGLRLASVVVAAKRAELESFACSPCSSSGSITVAFTLVACASWVVADGAAGAAFGSVPEDGSVAAAGGSGATSADCDVVSRSETASASCAACFAAEERSAT